MQPTQGQTFRSVSIPNDFKDFDEGDNQPSAVSLEAPVSLQNSNGSLEASKTASPIIADRKYRSARNATKTSYLDYYNIELPGERKSKATSSNSASATTKGRSEELLPVLPPKQAVDERSDSSNGLPPSEPMPLEESIPALLSGEQSYRTRAATSPLSSVPSDLDQNEVSNRTSTFQEQNASADATIREGRPKDRKPTGKRNNTVDNKDASKDRPSKRTKRVKISSPSKSTRQSPAQVSLLPLNRSAMTRVEADSRQRTKDDDQTSNDGHCSTCRGTGKLLCCDDCPRSFHFTCIEPPIEEEDVPDAPYFCMSCWDRRYGFPAPPPGLFQQLIRNETIRDPVVFALPEAVRNYFENVATGENGTYQAVDELKIPRKDRNGFAEEADLHRHRDRHGKVIACYKCGLSSIDSSGILSCDDCQAAWHLDCLSPPLQVPPSSTKKWICPLHAHDMIPLLRRPRIVRTLGTSLRRGFRNTGDIDVEVASLADSDSDSTSSSESEDSLSDVEERRVRYKLPADGIILDFLDTCSMQPSIEGRRILQVLDNGHNLQDLVNIALDSVNKTSDRANHERLQLLALKALMEVKGKHELLSWLQA